ncbi:MAG: hypothetical protein AAFU53_01435 [Cyanobacteria bacterium J06632_3]
MTIFTQSILHLANGPNGRQKAVTPFLTDSSPKALTSMASASAPRLNTRF